LLNSHKIYYFLINLAYFLENKAEKRIETGENYD